MRMTVFRWSVGCAVCAIAFACGGESDSEQTKPGVGGASDGGSGATISGGGTTSGGSGGAGGAGGASGGSAGASGSGGAPVDGGGGTAGGVTAIGRCTDAPPVGAVEPPAPKAYSGGTCPTLAPGPNTFKSAGADRTFLLVVPSEIQPGETLPLVFLWHWLKGEAQDFFQKAEVQKAVDAQRFIAVLPEQKGDLLFVWPVEIYQPETRITEELTLFDDLLSCIDAQYDVNRSCVSSVGVSAGALWTDQLAHRRSDYLSSFMSLSGGVDTLAIKPWGTPVRDIPGIVLWGGPTDNCIGLFSFETLSKQLEKDLTAGGNFFLECVHNCGHSEPPFSSGVSSKYQGLWQFVFDHPYWLTPGHSVYETEGIPSSLPAWCAIGAGNAVPLTGTCENDSAC
jgi:hypothetical protein